MPHQHQVREFMTVGAHTIGLDQSLTLAARRMRELHIRHLPVLHGGTLRGVLSERDIALVQALDLDPDEITVEEAMSPEPLTVAADTPLHRAARAMAAHRYGCAVVMEGAHVQGILTTTDALRALADLLESLGPEQHELVPSQVRNVILNEHVHIRHLLDRSEEHAQRILAGGGYSESEVLSLRGIAFQLYTGLCRHMELENRVLAPALMELDAAGKQKAECLIAEHAAQKLALEDMVAKFNALVEPPAALAAELTRLIGDFRLDMDREEETLLHPELFRDRP